MDCDFASSSGFFTIDPDSLLAIPRKEGAICFNCHKATAAENFCSNCNTVHFCSQNCAFQGYRLHSRQCNAIEDARLLMKSEEQKLQQVVIHIDDGYDEEEEDVDDDNDLMAENVFETRVGQFGSINECSYYLHCLKRLADMIYKVGSMTGSKVVLEEALFYYEHLLKLDVFDYNEVRYVIPFVLLDLNRDDEAFSFCYYWIEDLHDTDDHFGRDWKARAFVKNSHDNIFELFSALDLKKPYCSGEIEFLIVLFLIKMRLVTKWENQRGKVSCFIDTDTGSSIEQVQPVLMDCLVCPKIIIQNEMEQIHWLLNIIHSKNQTFLPALINPIPLMRQQDHKPRLQDHHHVIIRGHPSEAYQLYLKCGMLFDRMVSSSSSPSRATSLLIKRFGPRPSYNSDLTMLDGYDYY